MFNVMVEREKCVPMKCMQWTIEMDTLKELEIYCLEYDIKREKTVLERNGALTE